MLFKGSTRFLKVLFAWCRRLRSAAGHRKTTLLAPFHDFHVCGCLALVLGCMPKPSTCICHYGVWKTLSEISQPNFISPFWWPCLGIPQFFFFESMSSRSQFGTPSHASSCNGPTTTTKTESKTANENNIATPKIWLNSSLVWQQSKSIAV